MLNERLITMVCDAVVEYMSGIDISVTEKDVRDLEEEVKLCFCMGFVNPADYGYMISQLRRFFNLLKAMSNIRK